MKHSVSDELYSEILDSSNVEDHREQVAAQLSNTLPENDLSEPWYDDGSSGEEETIAKSTKISDMDREWQRRHDQFHTIGYRDGLIAGKEAAAQMGFNTGFKESVLSGYNWGLLRGITSATTCLPSGLLEKLVDKEETINEFQRLAESMQSLSTVDALKLFYIEQQQQPAKTDKSAGDSSTAVRDGSTAVDLNHQIPDTSVLESYRVQVQTLVEQCPLIEVEFQGKLV